MAGATGYVGVELVRLLSGHPNVDLQIVTSEQYQGRPLADIYPFLRGRVDHILEPLDVASIAPRVRTVLTALPWSTTRGVGCPLPSATDSRT